MGNRNVSAGPPNSDWAGNGCHCAFNKLFNRVRKEAGLKDAWSPDSTRHSYGTYHVAKYESKSKTALMMGHSVRMLDRHYRRPLHRSDTTEFWSIMPDETACRSKT
jgi:hypothetical protein